MVAIACGYGIYLTHTRAAWLSGVVVLIIGALIARGYRKGFIVAICLVASVVAVNWSVFTSSDRKAGGVGEVGRSAGSAQRRSDGALGVHPETLRRLGHRPVPGRQHLPPPAVGTGRTVDPRIRSRRA